MGLLRPVAAAVIDCSMVSVSSPNRLPRDKASNAVIKALAFIKLFSAFMA